MAPRILESPVPVFRRISEPDPLEVEKRADPDPRRQFSLPAMDCRAPPTVQSIATQDACRGRKRSVNIVSSHQILLLQRVEETVRTAVRCRKFVTKLDLICGSFSHSKIMLPPDVLKPVPVSEEECSTAAATGIYVDEIQRSHSVRGSNAMLQYKYVSSGSLTYSSNNVYCTGGTVKIGTDTHTDALELNTVELRIEKVQVAVRSDGKIQDLVDGQELPANCRDSSTCATPDKAFAFTDAPQVCSYKKVRTMSADLVNGKIAGKLRKLLVSNHTKSLIPIAESARPAPTACQHAFRAYVPTDLPLLAVVFSEDLLDVRKIETVSGPEISPDLEERVTDSFIEWSLRHEIEDQMLSLGTAMCQLTEGIWGGSEKSPFHQNHILR